MARSAGYELSYCAEISSRIFLPWPSVEPPIWGAGRDDATNYELHILFTPNPPHLRRRYVELLKAKNLSIGMRVWGVLLEVAPRMLTVSLPHGLRGHVAPEEVRQPKGEQGEGGNSQGLKEGRGQGWGVKAAERRGDAGDSFHY